MVPSATLPHRPDQGPCTYGAVVTEVARRSDQGEKLKFCNLLADSDTKLSGTVSLSQLHQSLFMRLMAFFCFLLKKQFSSFILTKIKISNKIYSSRWFFIGGQPPIPPENSTARGTWQTPTPLLTPKVSKLHDPGLCSTTKRPVQFKHLLQSWRRYLPHTTKVLLRLPARRPRRPHRGDLSRIEYVPPPGQRPDTTGQNDTAQPQAAQYRSPSSLT